MSGGVEGDGRRIEPTTQQPKQPEHTPRLQSRAAGRESLQGPTTVDRSEQLPPRQQLAEQVILTKLQEASELFGRLPHPLAQEFKDAMTKRAVGEAWRERYPELKRQAEELDEEVIDALQNPTLRKKY